MILEELTEKIKNETDLWPWYWYAYGEKCYGFSTVEAYPAKEENPFPDPGSQLTMNDNGKWIGENGVEMIIESEIANIEQQNGDTICSFIAGAHAHLIGKDLLTA